MKWHYHTLVVDLETSDDPGNREIIEIGAVLLNPKMERIHSFSRLCCPSARPSDFVIELTQIDTKELKLADNFFVVADQLHDWLCGDLGINIKKVRLAAWGNYFDINVLRNEYAKCRLEYPFSGTCIDVKTAALIWCSLAGKRTDSLSVEKMAEYLGIMPNGPYHRALVDAQATADIYRRVLADLAGGVWIDGKHIKVGI